MRRSGSRSVSRGARLGAGAAAVVTVTLGLPGRAEAEVSPYVTTNNGAKCRTHLYINETTDGRQVYAMAYNSCDKSVNHNQIDTAFGREHIEKTDGKTCLFTARCNAPTLYLTKQSGVEFCAAAIGTWDFSFATQTHLRTCRTFK